MNETCEKGEVICRKCNGSGEDKEHIFVCSKCNGDGNVDWVSNAVDPPEPPPSALRHLNIRIYLMHIKRIADINFPNIKNICDKIKEYLELLHQTHSIYDYKLETIYNHITVLLKPSRSVEIVKLDLKIEGESNGE